MNIHFAIYLAAGLLFSSASFAERQDTSRAGGTPSASAADNVKGERTTRHGLSTVLNKGIDRKGLTMEEKWSNDVVVCKRTQMTGSRFIFKICHTRGEWRAMRENARETVDHVQRIGWN